MLVCAVTVNLLKLKDVNHKGDTNQTNPTRAQYVTYQVNKQAKEEVACVGLNRSLEQPLQHMGMQYPGER